MYEVTDKGIKQMNRVIQHEFAVMRHTVLQFDEISVIQSAVNACYGNILRECKKIYLAIANDAYKSVTERDGMFSVLWLEQFLYGYDAVTKYVFTHEFDRKRARTFEAVVASKKTELSKEFKQAMYNLSVQTTQYADEVTDYAVLQGYIDSNIQRVRWVSEQDGRVCRTCFERNGRTYDVHKVPLKPHIRCRCYLLPASNKDTSG